MINNLSRHPFHLLVYSFLALLLVNCNKPAANNSKKLLEQALKNTDYATAAFAYNNLLLEDSTNMIYKDSLARIYIRSGNYEGGLRLGEQVMAKYPKNKKLLELVGVANEQLKKTDKSIANFKTLFGLTNDDVYLYKISAIYFDNNLYERADSLTDVLIEKVDSVKKININMQDGSSQTVSILAACYNMKGAILFKIGIDTQNGEYIKKSVPYFRKSLRMEPDFAYPRYYLENIAQMMQQQR